MKKLLFTRESARIQPLRTLIEKQRHRTLVAWTLDCAPRVLDLFEQRYPDDPRPRQALATAAAWAQGKVKMPEAKKAILAAHQAAAAAEDPAAEAAARAVGHAAATVHVETHALGLVLYGLTAFVRAANSRQADAVVERELKLFYDRLLYWEAAIDQTPATWAPFLLRDDAPNKDKKSRQSTCKGVNK